MDAQLALTRFLCEMFRPFCPKYMCFHFFRCSWTDSALLPRETHLVADKKSALGKFLSNPCELAWARQVAGDVAFPVRNLSPKDSGSALWKKVSRLRCFCLEAGRNQSKDGAGDKAVAPRHGGRWALGRRDGS